MQSKLLERIRPDEGKKYLFFGGKGGVGKTTMAAATATWFADHGYRTTIVSTDPTVSLSAIFHQPISGTTKTPILGVPNLHGININPEEASGVFQQRLNASISGLTNAFGNDLISTPCAEEMAAFDQFVEFLDEKESDIVVFDTAPTGHSLRELAMPFDWADFIKRQVEEGKEIAKLLPMDGDNESLVRLEEEKTRYDNAMETLKNKDKTIFNLVLLPAYLPIAETASAIKDLGGLGIEVQSFIINQIIPNEVVRGNTFLKARVATQERYLHEIRDKFGSGTLSELPLLETDVYDVETLRIIGQSLYGDNSRGER